MMDETKKEIEKCLKNGMTQMTKEELETTLDKLGYKIDKHPYSFDYFNSANEFKYKARSIHIINKKTRRSFAHCDEKRDDDFEKLQEIRFNCFVVHNGRYWEL